MNAPVRLREAAGGEATARSRALPAIGAELDGVQLIDVVRHSDARGSFTEVFADHWGLDVDPVQWSIVRSNPGVLRGMHLHLRHDEYLMVISGCLSVGLHDLRPDSPTSGHWARYDLSDAADQVLVWPRGVVHGWMATEPAVHLQAVSEAYVTYGLDDNNGCRWDDPGLGIVWPSEPSTISERASTFGSIAELRSLIAEGFEV